jgi:GNAT superfamily N-acetyltransferase
MDVAAAGEIAGAMQPPYLAEEGMTRWQDAYRVGDDRFCVAAASDDGSVVGCGALWRVRGERFRLDLMVHPRWQQRGVGGALLAHLHGEAKRQGAARLQARARDDRPSALSFLHHRGFTETQRMDRFCIRPADADASRLRAAIERVEQYDVVLTTLAAAQAGNAECLRKLHELYLAVIPGWPDPDPDPTPATPPSFPSFLRLVDSLADNTGTFLLAQVDDTLVGFCGRLGTAVHPDYRGWGIATAMEARVIERSRGRGCARLFGQTANAAMRAVYTRLGYQPVFSEVRLVQRLEGRAQ